MLLSQRHITGKEMGETVSVRLRREDVMMKLLLLLLVQPWLLLFLVRGFASLLVFGYWFLIIGFSYMDCVGH